MLSDTCEQKQRHVYKYRETMCSFLLRLFVSGFVWRFLAVEWGNFVGCWLLTRDGTGGVSGRREDEACLGAARRLGGKQRRAISGCRHGRRRGHNRTHHLILVLLVLTFNLIKGIRSGHSTRPRALSHRPATGDGFCSGRVLALLQPKKTANRETSTCEGEWCFLLSCCSGVPFCFCEG